MLSRAHVMALATGDGWIDRGGTILLFGRSGSGKSHLSAAFGHALIENGYRVLFTRATDLVQRLQQARQALSLESTIEKNSTNTTSSFSRTSAMCERIKLRPRACFKPDGRTTEKAIVSVMGGDNVERRYGARPGARRKP
jgi:energy-coupling factor transporter ATP-binding protein EcfA2